MSDFRFRMSDSDTRNTANPQPGGGDVLIDFGKLAQAARRQRRVLLLWIAGFCVLGLVYLATTPPSYRAAATVLLAGQSTGQVDNVAVTETVSDASVETAQQVFRSRDLALRVDDILALREKAAFMTPPASLASRTLHTLTGTVRAALDMLSPKPDFGPGTGGSADAADQALRDKAARSLQGDLIIERIGRSTALQIEFESHDPALAAQIVNAYTEAYTSDQLSTTFEATTRTTKFLQTRLADLETDARKAAMDAETFRAKAGLVATGDRLITEENLNRLNAELSMARAEAARSRALVASYDGALARGVAALTGGAGGRLSLPGDTRLTEMGQALSTLTQRRDGVMRNFGADHPQIAVLDAQIEQSAQRLYAEMERQAEVARGELAVAEARVASLRDAIVPLNEENSEALRAQIEYRLLKQRTDTLMRLYETFLSQFQGAEQLRLYSGSQIRVLTPAEIPRGAASPSAKRVLALMIVLGLMAGLAHAGLREWRERYVRTAADVTDGLKLRFLGYLPPLPVAGRNYEAAPESAKDTAAMGAQLIQYPLAHITAPRTRYSETLRTIRHISSTVLPGQGGTVIGVTSILPGVGKTALAADLAGILSVSSHNVLLIDGDPRSQQLSRLLGLGAKGDLAEVIEGSADWRDCRVSIAGTNVEAIGWSGKATLSHPADVLSSRMMREFLIAAAREYSHVVVDLGPLGPVVDARELIALVDQVVLLALWGKTPYGLISETLEQEPELSSRVLGMVLGDVDMRELKNYVGPAQVESFDEELAPYFE
ncbi:Wzz/FepE/Etk N-terminal domain-containing protein [Phaeovulum sp.]|uniref:Wzz/FepE/Etk N-terminal domain-containing protein n=1 Tax=Phaeovulum sp. TaxID=2934796 RepID=UPI0039E5E3E3